MKKEKQVFTISITVTSLAFSGIVFQTSDINFAHNFIVKTEFIRSHLVEDNKNNQSKDVSININDNDTLESIYEKINFLKKLFDEGIIDSETYNEKKEELLKKIKR